MFFTSSSRRFLRLQVDVFYVFVFYVFKSMFFTSLSEMKTEIYGN